MRHTSPFGTSRWQKAQIRHLASIITGPFGTLLKASEYGGPNGVPVISVGEIRDGYLRITESTPRVDSIVTKRLPQYLLREGDIVFGRKGGVERSARIDGDQKGWFLGSDGIVIRPKGTMDSVYFGHAMRATTVQRWLLQNALGTTMPSLNQTVLGAVEVLFPEDIREQRAIAEALADVDRAVAGLERLIDKKRDLKQATMQQLLTGQTRLPGFSKEWHQLTLSGVLEHTIGGGTPPRSNRSFWGGRIPWATVKDLTAFNPQRTQESITEQGLNHSASKLIRAGTLIIATRMALGKAVVFDVDVAINQDLKALFFNEEVDVGYIRRWFEFFGHRIDELGGGSTVKGISISELRSLALELPEKMEQSAILDVLSDMDAELSTLQAQLDKTRLIKQAMMQELLTGRTRLRF